LLRVVQSSLLGSILSNLLLVMGMSFLAGGMFHKSQFFNQTGAQTSASLLLLAVMAILFPAAFTLSGAAAPENLDYAVLQISRITAVVILCVYFLYLFFQLKTHAHLFDDTPSEKVAAEMKKEAEQEENEAKEEGINDEGEEEDDDEEETPRLSLWGAIVFLVIVTVIVAVLAEFLVDSINEVTIKWGVSQTFVGIVLLPIVGNAAEHVTAVSVAMKNKMDLSIGVALGSSIQIALLVIPLLVIIGWGLGKELTLYFQAFETVVLFMSVIIVNAVISDGESNWLEGSLLCVSYFIIAVAFFYHM